jgi:hypothetical protein
MEPTSPAPTPSNQPGMTPAGDGNQPVAPVAPAAPAFAAAQTVGAPAQEDPSAWYIRNPFTVALSGISVLKNLSKGLFILFLVLSILSALSNFSSGPSFDDSSTGMGDETSAAYNAGYVVGTLVGLAAFFFLLVVVWGMQGYASAKIAKGEGTTIKEAFMAAVKNFGRLFVIGLIVVVKTILWSLLFLIPGLIMQIRYSLAPTIAFAEPELSPSAVVTRSVVLTKNAWFDTMGARGWFSLVTLGFATLLTEVGASGVLYRQLRRLHESGQKKPSTHPLNYVLPVLFVLLMVIVFVVLIAIYAVAGSAMEGVDTMTPSSFN